jgi:NAD(P)-dependent dehydrogenase (short-subunit alcohol dehydrogenase family)
MKHCFTNFMTQTWFITGSSRGFGRALARAALEAPPQTATFWMPTQTVRQHGLKPAHTVAGRGQDM